MYGLLLENLAEYIKLNYGEDKWDDIRRQAGIDAPSFSVHQVYPENLLQKLAKKAQQVSASLNKQKYSNKQQQNKQIKSVCPFIANKSLLLH